MWPGPACKELRLDYEDFLRQRNLPLWERADPRRGDLIGRRCATADEVATWVREIYEKGRSGGRINGPVPSTPSTGSTRSIKSTYPEISANAALVLIAVACGLLDRQITAQARAFEKEGGFTERLYRHRTRARQAR